MMLRRHVSPGRALFGALVLAAAAVTVGAALEPRFPLDLALTRAWQGHIPAVLEPVMTAVNEWAAAARWLVAGALLAYGFATRRRFVWFIIVPIVASIVVPGLKEIVDRPRPGADLVRVLEHPDSTSFPSGHVLNTTTFLGLLYVMVADLTPPGAVRTAVRAACIAFIVAVGPARVYAGAHWPSDVLGGYLIGVVLLTMIVKVYRTRVRVRGEPGPMVEYRHDG